MSTAGESGAPDPLDHDLAALLARRANVEPAAVEGVRSSIRTLPGRRSRRRALAARAAAAVVVLGVGAFAIARAPVGPAASPDPAGPLEPVLQEPSAFAGDARTERCPIDDAIYAFTIERLGDFRAYYADEGFPSDDLPALVVVRGTREAADRIRGPYFLTPGHYAVCIAPGEPDAEAAAGPIAVTDADLSALLPAPDMVGNPLRHAADPRFERCGGLVGDVVGAFEMAHARDYRAHLPAMGAAPELDVDDPAFVVLFRADHPLGAGRPGVGTPAPRLAGTRDVCVLVGFDPVTAPLYVYPEVDPAGATATLDNAPAPTAVPSRTPQRTEPPDPSVAVTPTPTPLSSDPIPAWATDLLGQLECDAAPAAVGHERGTMPPLGETGTASVGPWLAGAAPEVDLPVAAWVIDPENRWEYGEAAYTRHVYRAGGTIKALILMEGYSRQNDRGAWRVTAWRSCAPDEFDEHDGRTTDDGPWLGPGGARSEVVDSLPGPGHCGWQSTVWLRFRERLYLRDPFGVFADATAGSFARGVDLPAGATDTGQSTARWRLYASADPDAVWIRTDAGYERWPRALDPDIGCV